MLRMSCVLLCERSRPQPHPFHGLPGEMLLKRKKAQEYYTVSLQYRYNIDIHDIQ